jgi:outer membrane protein assembly factor BamB
MYTHPLLHDELVVVGDAQGYLYAFEVESGTPRWEVQLTGSIRGGASSDGSTIFAVSQGGEAIALSGEGRELWRERVMRPPWNGQGADVPIEAYSPPIVTEQRVIVPFARDTYYDDVPALLALDQRTGQVVWRARGPGQWGNVRSTPALVDGVLVYGEPYSGDVVGISANTGRLVFRKEVGPCTFPQWSSPAGTSEVVYVPRFAGSVYAVRPSSGKVLWGFYLGDSRAVGDPPPGAQGTGCNWDAPQHALYSPASIAPDGTLLVGSEEGYLYALDDGA